MSIPVYEKNSQEDLALWYCYKGGKPDERMPAFIDDHQWKWVKDGEAKAAVIRNEIEALIAKKSGVLDPYFNTTLLAQGKWEVLNFYFWEEKNEINCAACPELTKWLSSIPGLTTAGVSRLAPHTEIKPHPGDTNGIARCHFGLSIPASLPACGITVNGESRSWENGKILLFSDAYIHEAWNKTDQFRYVLILDVVLPRFMDRKKSIVSNVRSFLKLQSLFKRKPWVENLPGPVLGIIRHLYKFTGA